MSVMVEMDGAGVAVIRLASGPVNAISTPLRTGLLRALVQVEEDPKIEAAVVTGSGSCFSAGADLTEFSQGRAFDYPSFHAAVLPFLHGMRKPVVAAINGRAIGGGLELALWCHARVAVPDAPVGLPETSLGLMPGAGGTQLLPRALGLERATALIVAGAVGPACDFEGSALFDDLCPPEELLARATALARQLAASGQPLPHLSRRVVEHAQAEGFLQFARRQAQARRDFVLGMRLAIDAIALSLELPALAGLAREFELFRPLVASAEARAIRYTFFAERSAAKLDPRESAIQPLPVARAAVVGAGFMGAGIAHCLARAGLSVLIHDVTPGAAERAVEKLRAIPELAVADIRPAGSLADLGDADLVVEAVVENLSVKRDLFRALDQQLSPQAILASNTSTLDLDQIAAATAQPGRVVGMHFFGPAPVMKLLELVRGRATAAVTLVTALALARRMRKVAVVAGVGPGFIANRIYNRFMAEALGLAAQGVAPQAIDTALERWGWRMGPFKTMDLIGLDVLVRGRLAPQGQAPGDAFQDRLVALGRLGQKAGRGWYDYDGGRPRASPEVEALLPAAAARPAAEAIVSQCMAALINEGGLVLDEGIARHAADIDTCFVHGYGFPRLKGGPMFTAEEAGLINVLQTVEQHRRATGADAWRPSVRLAHSALASGRWDPLNPDQS